MTCFNALPPEILPLIWKNFNRTDLLNIRLVCHFWNKESLRTLQNSSFRLHLSNKVVQGEDPNENCLEKFLQFATTKSQQFVLPFVLHFRTLEYNEGPENLNLFICNVQILLELFGQTCVKHLKIWISSKPEVFYENVLKLLALISNDLEEFTWEGFKETQESPAIPIVEEKLQNQPDLVFPKLNRLALTSYTCGDNSFWKYFMPKAPGLKEIELEILQMTGYIHHQWTWPTSLPVNLVCKLKIQNFHEHSSYILHQFGQNGLNMAPLRSLELDLDVKKFLKNAEEISRIGEFLKQFSSNLESLVLALKFSRTYGEEDFSSIPECPFPFPIFPKLRHLKMTKTWEGEPIRIILNKSNLFPALESLEIQHDLLLLFKNDDLDLDKFFPSVKFITLLISPKNAVYLNCDEYMGLFLSQFPQIYKINLVNDFTNSFNIDRACEGGMMKCILTGLIQSNQATSLKEIELIDCSKNYLGIALAQMVKGPKFTLENLPTDTGNFKDQLIAVFQRLTGIADFEVIESKNENGQVTNFCAHPRKDEGGRLENVKMIKLSISPRGRHVLKIVPLQLEDLHIADMSDVCPRLEQIQISSFLVAPQDTEAQAKILEGISTQFPKIKVDFGCGLF